MLKGAAITDASAQDVSWYGQIMHGDGKNWDGVRSPKTNWRVTPAYPPSDAINSLAGMLIWAKALRSWRTNV
jgi:hypothetical protein